MLHGGERNAAWGNENATYDFCKRRMSKTKRRMIKFISRRRLEDKPLYRFSANFPVGGSGSKGSELIDTVLLIQ